MADGPARTNLQPLALHVPEPRSRPGDPVDFSDVVIPAAGSMARPDETISPHDMRDAAFGLVRVLDEQHQAVGPWDPRLSPETLL